MTGSFKELVRNSGGVLEKVLVSIMCVCKVVHKTRAGSGRDLSVTELLGSLELQRC